MVQSCNHSKEETVWMPPFKSKGEWQLCVLNWGKCSTCQTWHCFSDRKGRMSFEEHIKKCYACKCGFTFTDERHKETCRQRIIKNNVPFYIDNPQICKIFEPSKAENFIMKDVWCSDFEAFPRKSDSRFEVYCAVLLPPDKTEPEDVLYWVGLDEEGIDPLTHYMNYVIEKVKGTLWFYNGVNFDNILLFEWLFVNQIEMKNIIMTKSKIISLSFLGKKGWIQLRDLNRFLDFSLDKNCRELNIPEKYRKKDSGDLFLKINSFDDVFGNEEAIIEYARNDATALQQLIKLYGENTFKDWKIDFTKFPTGSALSYAIFSTTVENAERKLLKIPTLEEGIFRELYRGGRLICNTKYWFCPNYHSIISAYQQGVEPNVIEEMIENLKDWGVHLDVNSLYPSAMIKQKYPCGNYQIRDLDEEESKRKINPLEQLAQTPKGHAKYNAYKKLKDYWQCIAVLVDIECPKDLLVPFLMSRDPAGRKGDWDDLENIHLRQDLGKCQQNLLTKEKTWYTGVEIFEAYRIGGYKIKRIYKIIEWEFQEVLFKKFIEVNYNYKKNAKTEAEKVGPKNNMNRLSGKLGQKMKKVNTTVLNLRNYSPNDKKWNQFEETPEKIRIPLNADRGESLAFLDYLNQEDYSPFPVQLSAFILAKSKQIMSKIMRELNGYRIENRAPFYGDTDSIIIPYSTFKDLPAKWIGKELKQLKDELEGMKVLALLTIAPKTYMEVFYNPKTQKIECKMKSKGIPHEKEAYDPFNIADEFTQSEETQFRNELILLWTRDKPVKNVQLKYYRFLAISPENAKKREETIRTLKLRIRIFQQIAKEEEDTDSNTLREAIVEEYEKAEEILYQILDESYVFKKLTPKLIKKLLKGVILIEAVFGQFRRNVVTETFTENIGIIPDYSVRSIVGKDGIWWDKGFRSFRDPCHPPEDSEISYPVGHQALEQ